MTLPENMHYTGLQRNPLLPADRDRQTGEPHRRKKDYLQSDKFLRGQEPMI